MNNISEYMSESIKLYEMSLSRPDAIERCYSLGKQFIEHFHKIYLANYTQSTTIHHWASEMQSWYNAVTDIVLKTNHKHLNGSQLKDWFYSFGSSYEEYFDNNTDEIELYEQLIDLLAINHSVINSINILFKEV